MFDFFEMLILDKEAVWEIIKASGILKSERKVLFSVFDDIKWDNNLARVLVYEFLFGKGVSGKLKSVVEKYKTRLNAELVKLKIKRKVKTNSDLIPDSVKNMGKCLYNIIDV
jgi:putative methyltransferase